MGLPVRIVKGTEWGCMKRWCKATLLVRDSTVVETLLPRRARWRSNAYWIQSHPPGSITLPAVRTDNLTSNEQWFRIRVRRLSVEQARLFRLHWTDDTLIAQRKHQYGIQKWVCTCSSLAGRGTCWPCKSRSLASVSRMLLQLSFSTHYCGASIAVVCTCADFRESNSRTLSQSPPLEVGWINRAPCSCTRGIAAANTDTAA
jgi:hypothetical protein